MPSFHRPSAMLRLGVAAVVALLPGSVAGRADEPKPLAVLTTHEHPVTLISFAPAGKPLIVTSDTAGVRLSDTATGRELARLNDGDLAGPALAVAWNPKGSILAISYGKFEQNRRAGPRKDEALAIWDVSTPARPKRTYRTNTAAPEVLAFSPDGGTLAGVFEYNCHLYGLSKDLGLQLQAKSLLSPSGSGFVDTVIGHASRMAFSPDGMRLGVLHTFDTKNGEQNLAFLDCGEKSLSAEDRVEAAAAPQFVGKQTNAAVAIGFFAAAEPFNVSEHGNLSRWKIARNGKVVKGDDDSAREKETLLRDDADARLAAAVLTPDRKGFVTVQRHGETHVRSVHWAWEGNGVRQAAASPKVEPAVPSPLLALAPDGSIYAVTGRRNTVELYPTALKTRP